MKKILLITLLITSLIGCEKIKDNSTFLPETNVSQNDQDKNSLARRSLSFCPTNTEAAGPDKIICPTPGSVQIGLPAETGLTYHWTPTQGLSNPNISNPIASPSAPTTYTLTTSGFNAIRNGNFELGNTQFSTPYTYWNGIIQWHTGLYYIGTNPFLYNRVARPLNNWCNTTNHTPNGQNMLIADGVHSPNPAPVWAQFVVMSPGIYNFSAWFLNTNINAIPEPSNPQPFANIQLRIDGIDVGPPILLSNLNCEWVNLSFNVSYTGPNDGTLLELVNLTTSTNGGAGNDFAIDDIFLGCPITMTDQVTVNVCVPPAITASSYFAKYDCTVTNTFINYPIVPNSNNNYCFYWECGGISHIFSNIPNSNNQWYINDVLVTPTTIANNPSLGSVDISTPGELKHGLAIGHGGPLFKFQVKNTTYGYQQLSPPTYVYYAGYIGPSQEEMGWYKQNYTRTYSTPFNNRVGPNAIYTWSVPGCTINDIDNTTPEAIITFPASVPITGITGTLTISNSYCQNGSVPIHFTYNANAQ